MFYFNRILQTCNHMVERYLTLLWTYKKPVTMIYVIFYREYDMEVTILTLIPSGFKLLTITQTNFSWLNGIG